MTQTTSTHQLTVAVIGAGAFVYGMHRPGLADHHFKTVAVCDINAEKLAARANEIGCSAYTNHRDLLADVQPDLAVVMTPPPWTRVDLHRLPARWRARARREADRCSRR